MPAARLPRGRKTPPKIGRGLWPEPQSPRMTTDTPNKPMLNVQPRTGNLTTPPRGAPFARPFLAQAHVPPAQLEQSGASAISLTLTRDKTCKFVLQQYTPNLSAAFSGVVQLRFPTITIHIVSFVTFCSAQRPLPCDSFYALSACC